MRHIIAGDVMTPTILKVDASTTVAQLSNFLIDNEITGAVVTNEGGEPVGVVSATDIVALAALDGDVVEPERPNRGFYTDWPDSFDDAELKGMHVEQRDLTVEEFMTPEIFTVAVDTPASEVARLMCDSHLHRVLVTAQDEFVGIVTTSDLLGLLVDDVA